MEKGDDHDLGNNNYTVTYGNYTYEQNVEKWAYKIDYYKYELSIDAKSTTSTVSGYKVTYKIVDKTPSTDTQRVYLYLENNNQVNGELNKQGYFTIGYVDVSGLQDPQTLKLETSAEITDAIVAAIKSNTVRFEANKAISLEDIDWKGGSLKVKFEASSYPDEKGKNTWHLDAKLKENANVYTVTYQWYDSTKVPDNVSLPTGASGSSFPVSAGEDHVLQTYVLNEGETSPNGFTFDGWYCITGTDENTGVSIYTKVETKLEKVTENITLYGKWTEDVIIPTGITIPVTKTWSDDSAEARPGSITLSLYSYIGDDFDKENAGLLDSITLNLLCSKKSLTPISSPK